MKSNNNLPDNVYVYSPGVVHLYDNIKSFAFCLMQKQSLYSYFMYQYDTDYSILYRVRSMFGSGIFIR